MTSSIVCVLFDAQDVKAALHVDGSVAWEDCTDRVDYNDGDQLLYMEPLYNFLLCVRIMS